MMTFETFESAFVVTGQLCATYLGIAFIILHIIAPDGKT